MIDVDISRYSKIGRADALALLEQAQLAPEKLIAHRNRTFTARYHRDQVARLSDAVIEALDQRIAIFKRPSAGLDRGRYVTLTFALADIAPAAQAEADPTPDAPAPSNGSAAPVDPTLVVRMLQRLTEDMCQIIHYADEMTDKATRGLSTTRRPEINHLKTALKELSDQATLMQTALWHIP